MEPAARRPSLFWNISTLFMVGMVACYAFVQYVVIHLGKPYDIYLALSGYGMKSGHVWEVFTYQFFSKGWIHFVINLALLWLVARRLERKWGTKRFTIIYTIGVVLGGILQGLAGLAGFLLPESEEIVAAFLRDHYGGPVVGGSVGLIAVIVAWCRTHPRQRLIRTPFKLWHLLVLFWIAAIVLVIVPTDPDFAHISHLVAVVCGTAVRSPKPESRGLKA